MQDYEKEYKTTSEPTLNLMKFLNETDKNSIRFDDYYSFFISKKDYRLTLKNIQNKDNTLSRGCSWYCVIGCGSSHGCCGNYSGCCFYRHLLCYVHDKICTNCDVTVGGRNICFSGCVPDYQVSYEREEEKGEGK